MGGNRDDAKDTLSGVMLRAFDKLPKHANKINSPKAWLAKLTQNFCIDIHRARQRRQAARSEAALPKEGDESLAPVTSPEKQLFSKENLSSIRHLIASLSPALQEVIVRKFIENQSYADIANALDLSPAAVRKRIERARNALRQRLQSQPSGGAAARELATGGGKTARHKSARERSYRPSETEELSFHPIALRLLNVTFPSGKEAELYIGLPPKEGRLLSRLASLEKYVHHHPSGWKKRLERADILYRLGRWSEAIIEYRTGLRAQRRSLAARLRLGNLLQTFGQSQEAMALYRSTLPLARQPATRHHLNGLIEVSLHNEEAAITAFKQARSLEPQVMAHRYALGQLYLQKELPAEVLRLYADLRQSDDADLLAASQRQQALMMMERFDEAEMLAARVCEADAGNLFALKFQVDRRCKRGLAQGAEGLLTRRLLKKMIRLSPASADVCESLAVYQLMRGKWKPALRLLFDFTSAHPMNDRGWLHYARWLYLTGSYEAAAEAIRQAFALCQDMVELYKPLCDILSATGQLAFLLPILPETLRRFPERWSLWATSARALVSQAVHQSQACQYARKACRLASQLAEAWFAYGQVLAAAGRHEQAVEAFAAGWPRLPQAGCLSASIEAAVQRAISHLALGDRRQALLWAEEGRRRAQRLSEIDPAMSYYWQAKAAELSGDASAALPAYEHALTLHLLFPQRAEALEAVKRLRANGMDYQPSR